MKRILTLALCGLPLLAYGQVSVKKTDGALPLDPTAPAWQAAKAAKVVLSPQVISVPNGGGTVKEVEVRGLHNGKEIAFAVSYGDTSANVAREVARFQDMAALMFPAAGADYKATSPFMGDPAHKAAIWLWRADFAGDLNGSSAQRLEEQYPNYSDFTNKNNETTTQKFRMNANKAKIPSEVEALTAAGFGTLTRDSAESVQGKSKLENGKRTVVFTRSLASTNATSVVFQPGTATGLNLAIWEGVAGERGSRKSVGMAWTEVTWE